jgi:hypothetical protein
MPRTAHACPPAVRSSDPPTSDSEWHAACDRCGEYYTLAGWLRLAMVAQVESAWLATHVVSWQAQHVIEVRRCARCATPMSRRRHVAAGP